MQSRNSGRGSIPAAILALALIVARGAVPGQGEPAEDPDLVRFGIYGKTAPRPERVEPVATRLPLELRPGDRIALIGNTLLERSQHFGHFEALLHQRYPKHGLVVRNLAWPADTPDLQPRPANFADTEQHLFHEKIDVIFAAFGFNESFEGEAGLARFRGVLSEYVAGLKSKAFNGKTGPRIVLLSPIACENIAGVAAADLNNARLRLYRSAIEAVAAEQEVGFADVFAPTLKAMEDPASDLTLNGVHLLEAGYELFARSLYKEAFGEDASVIHEALRQAIIDKDRQYFRRFRPPSPPATSAPGKRSMRCSTSPATRARGTWRTLSPAPSARRRCGGTGTGTRPTLASRSS